MLRKNNKGGISTYAFIIMMLVTGISASLYGIIYDTLYIEKAYLYSSQSYYAAETGIEKGLYQFKINPSIDSFVGENEIINENRQKKQIEYRDQYFYRLERVIEELIPAGKNIQLFFDNNLNPNITKFHIAYLKRDSSIKPISIISCGKPKFNATIELGVFSTVHEYPGGVSDNLLKTTNNKCEGGFGSASKSSFNTINDPYSENKHSLAGGRCLLNNKGNVIGGVSAFENSLSYIFDDKGTLDDDSDNICILTYGANPSDKYFSTDEEVLKKIDGYIYWTTIIDGLDVASMMTKDDDKIMLDIRAVDEDVSILVWATDDNGIAYDIPGRYINFTATGKASGKFGLENDIYRRIIVKRKINKDILPIFDYTLFSESEFIK